MAICDDDFALALQLQEQFNEEETSEKFEAKNLKSPSLVDPYWEMTDPNPDVRALFLQFNDRFFWGRLAGVEVRWSPRMTLCAGLCCYEGRGGLCSVRLSVPLLKLRPRKDLVETLLHEMIHAYLFVTDNNKDHDGHGPEFHKHMYRINKEAGTNITVYHNFHDEVESYRQHWWRCDGPCRNRKPYYGYVKRTMNRAPSKNDTWWAEHQRTCGGTYTKVKEPEDYGKKKGKEKDKEKDGKEMKKEAKPSIKSMDIRIFGGKGVTLSGQTTNSSGSTISSAVSSSVKNSSFATITSADVGNVDSDSNSSSWSTASSAGSSSVKKSSSATITSADVVCVDSDSNSSSWSTASSAGSSSVKKASSATITSANVGNANSSSFLVKANTELTSAGKIAVNSDSSVHEGSVVTDKNKSQNMKQSKFTDSDFSDSDDDFMFSIPDEQSSQRKISDSKKNLVNDERQTDTSRQEKDENPTTEDGDDDVRAMLRKVWGQKNLGNDFKKKVTKKVSGILVGNKGKSNPPSRINFNKVESKGLGFINAKKIQTKEVEKSNANLIHNYKKRQNVVDSSDVSPVRKRLKTVSVSNDDEMETASDSHPFGDTLNKHFRDTFNGQLLKNDKLLAGVNEQTDTEFVNKIKTAVSPDGNVQTTNASNTEGPKQSVTPEKQKSSKTENIVKSPLQKLFDTVKSPIEKLFDKIRDKNKSGESNKETSTTYTSVSRNNADTDTSGTNITEGQNFGAECEAIPVVTQGTDKMQDISSCPVCNQGVPTATINDHLDLCLTLNAI